MDISAVTEQGNTAQQGTDRNTGQPEEGSQITDGQPTNDMPTLGEPDSGGEPNEITPEKHAALEKDYKSLQSEFTKRTESEKGIREKLQAFGGVDKAAEHLKFLAEDPSFAKWVSERQTQEVIGGQDISNMDEDQRQALEIVQKVARQTINSELDRFKRENFDPLATSYQKDTISSSLNKLEQKYGDIYRDNKEAMADIVGQLPPDIQRNPSADDLESLLWSVIVKNGNLEKTAAQYHHNLVETKKSNSTNPPPTTKGVQNLNPPKDLYESFQRAKQTLGITGEVKI